MSFSHLANRKKLKQFTVSALTLSVGSVIAVSAAAADVDCTNLAQWDASKVYNGGAQVQHNNNAYHAAYWTQNNNPDTRSGPWQEWVLDGACIGGPINEDPVTVLSAPASVNQGDTVNLSATATDTDGTVSSVAFYQAGNLIATDSTSPFEASFVANVAGNIAVKAVATDNDNGTGEDNATVNVIGEVVPQPPTASVSAVANATVGDVINFAATASDSDGTVTKVEFYLDGVLLDTDMSNPYAVNWTAVLGSHTLYVVATDNDGLSTQSSSVTFNVTPPSTNDCDAPVYSESASYVAGDEAQNIDQQFVCKVTGWCDGAAWAYEPGVGAHWQMAWDKVKDCDVIPNILPTIELTAPVDANYLEGATVSMAATASDTDGTIAQVEFYVDNQSVGVDTTAPYTADWQAVVGTHAITASATDNLGGAAMTQAFNVVVTQTPNILPAATAGMVVSGQIEGSNITLTATATDEDGSIASVEFFIDGISVGTDTSAPYTANYVAVNGGHELTVQATDNRGGVSALSAVEAFAVIQDPNQAPVVSVDAVTGSYIDGDVITLSATATDDMMVDKVDFYINNVNVGSDATAPYSIQWTSTAGNKSFKATATDDMGKTGESAAVSFTVDIDPTKDQEACRPDGLISAQIVGIPYCDIYDTEGREKMGDKTRRVIGYFTSWRNGANGQPTYLVPNIPWESLTHINYAFAHVQNNEVSVGASIETNPALGMEWPNVQGAQMDNAYPYKGHFNLLNKYKKQYPHVKTLVSVGGWAETGGYFSDDGPRVDDGGFYTMTTNADGSVNTAGINKFADSVVKFLRDYGFDGADIDYEYATSMKDAGNPLDFTISNARRGGLNASYAVLMKTLREKLDAASVEDGQYYMLTVAAPSSGYLLRGMETYDSAKYLDYVNIMSYDLHGAWNQFVGPNAALFDNGDDAELKVWNAYGGKYENVGYLNTDWAVHYFRGSLPAGRINIGVPYYTRGWKGVQGGTNGLWGTASFADQGNCPDGTGTGEKNDCGNGATHIDNLWHDKNSIGDEMGAGSNPMWHAKNLENAILGSYMADYGLDTSLPEYQLQGTYTRHYNSTMVAPWLWNNDKKVFISTEDEESIAVKADYVVDNELGGIMFWELAGDYAFDSAKGEYYMGSTLTDMIANRFATAAPYGNTKAEIVMPTKQVDVSIELTGFALGDSNYPINPDLIITNNTDVEIPGGSTFDFDFGTSAPSNMAEQSEVGFEYLTDGANAAGNNIGGLDNNFHRARITMTANQKIAPGGSLKVPLNYYLPISTPSNWVVNVGLDSFAIKQEHPNLEAGSFKTGGSTTLCSDINVNPADYPVYPTLPNGDHVPGGGRIVAGSTVFEAKYWTNANPLTSEAYNKICSFE